MHMAYCCSLTLSFYHYYLHLSWSITTCPTQQPSLYDNKSRRGGTTPYTPTAHAQSTHTLPLTVPLPLPPAIHVTFFLIFFGIICRVCSCTDEDAILLLNASKIHVQKSLSFYFGSPIIIKLHMLPGP